jgi:hypothetical protein
MIRFIIDIWDHIIIREQKSYKIKFNRFISLTPNFVKNQLLCYPWISDQHLSRLSTKTVIEKYE